MPASQSVLFQKRMQSTSGPAHKTLALGVFVSTRGLTHHHHQTVKTKLREIRQDDLGARGTEG
jgi:hypothetical protein